MVSFNLGGMLVQQVILPMSGFFLGALLTYCIWCLQRRAELIQMRLREFTIFSATNSDILLDLEYYLGMKRTQEGMKVLQKDSNANVYVPAFPSKRSVFLNMDKSIFGVINERKTLALAVHLYSQGEKTKHRFDLIHEQVAPVLQKVVFEGKKEGDTYYDSLTSEGTIGNIDTICESFMNLVVGRVYLSFRLEAIKRLKAHKKEVKEGSDLAKNIDKKSETLTEEHLNRSFDSLKTPSDLSEIENAKKYVFSCWEKIQMSAR